MCAAQTTAKLIFHYWVFWWAVLGCGCLSETLIAVGKEFSFFCSYLKKFLGSIYAIMKILPVNTTCYRVRE